MLLPSEALVLSGDAFLRGEMALRGGHSDGEWDGTREGGFANSK